MDIGLTKETTTSSVNLLQKLLANEYLLALKTQKAHWNVEGQHFPQYHEFLEEQYSELFEVIDDVAERVRQLGEFPVATLKQFLEKTSLSETAENGSARELLGALLLDHEQLVREIRSAIDACSADVGTEDFFTGLLQKHEKMAWMLRATCKQ